MTTARSTAQVATPSRTAGSTPASVRDGGDVVQISDAARAAAAALQKPSPADNAITARSKLDALYADAGSDGTFITFDTAKGGRQLDMSALSDDELAAIAVDHGGAFSQDESNDAGGWLNLRLAKTLQPFQNATMSGDRRAHAMTLNALYDNASQDVRDALGWTPAMRSEGDTLLSGDVRHLGTLDWSPIFTNLREASNNGGMTYRG
ncbi:hypothetical protein [Sphingomonas sp. ERG5]|uniref:hypothetical protein n=1 Tax=Sphingomonas sp. ERG5 TaxID=1381597 RepID=UPI001364B95A|nr:hypothetical protein [Sphingomonas sp. ERG5]